MSNIAIAETILKQMGGTGRLKAMTGAKNFVAIENGVRFNIGRNAYGVNTVTIKLNDLDLYDMEFGRVRKVKGMPTYKILETFDGAYNDMLVSVFEKLTGMYLTF